MKVPKVSEALSARIVLLKLIVPKAQTLILAHFSSLYTLGTFYKATKKSNLKNKSRHNILDSWVYFQ